MCQSTTESIHTTYFESKKPTGKVTINDNKKAAICGWKAINPN